MEQAQNKIVDFYKYCKTCAFREVVESEEPCNECLTQPVNLYSHKPVKWKEGNERIRKYGKHGKH